MCVREEGLRSSLARTRARGGGGGVPTMLPFS